MLIRYQQLTKGFGLLTLLTVSCLVLIAPWLAVSVLALWLGWLQLGSY